MIDFITIYIDLFLGNENEWFYSYQTVQGFTQETKQFWLVIGSPAFAFVWAMILIFNMDKVGFKKTPTLQALVGICIFFTTLPFMHIMVISTVIYVVVHFLSTATKEYHKVYRSKS